MMVDNSNSTYSQIISPSTDPTLVNVRAIFGSKVAVNSINGSNETLRIVGGQMNDTIIGGWFVNGEDILGMDGNDTIDAKGGDDHILGGDGNDSILGGEGDDVIYGGKGADTIDGGSGSDTIVFAGNGTNATGVMVNLQIGKGWYGDAEGDSYRSIENILGSEYNDTLIGNDDNNIIRGYGGDDYIIPAGGVDMLQGGLGSDIYDMKNAFGLKAINNFATDNKTDVVLLPGVKYDQMCYFYLEDDLHVVIDYSQGDVKGTMRRLFLAEQYLEIKVLNFLLNKTYSHINFAFSDDIVFPKKQLNRDLQIKSVSKEMQNGTMLSMTSVTSTSLVLNINVTFLNDSNTQVWQSSKLFYAHNEGKSDVQTHSVSLSDEDIVAIPIANLQAGVEQLFSLILVVCNVKVAMSSLVSSTTLPNPPTHVTITDTAFDGFTIQWMPPSNATDPNVYHYNYTIKFWRKDHSKEVTVVNYTEGVIFKYSVYGLPPKEDYEVTIASNVYGVQGKDSSTATVRTNSSLCSNFDILSDHMHIEKIERFKNNSELLAAYLYCDERYNLIGDRYVICNETPTHKPQCIPAICDIPPVESFNAFPISITTNSTVSGHVAMWNCSAHYWTADGMIQFNSTCDDDGQWWPTLEPCVLKPACNKTSLANGKVTPEFAYVGETITFTCDQPHYARFGPEKKLCDISLFSLHESHHGSLKRQLLSEENMAFIDKPLLLDYYPVTPVECVRRMCPKLIPQPHGKYSLEFALNKTFYGGDTLELKCDLGYYVENNCDHPEKRTLTCTAEGFWNVEQTQCAPILEVVTSKVLLFQVVGLVHYTIPKCTDISTFFNNSHHYFACGLIGGYNPEKVIGMEITCSINYQLTDHPPLSNSSIDVFTGALTMMYQSNQSDIASGDVLCFSDDTDTAVFARLVCEYLGYGEYTANVVSTGSFNSTKEITFKEKEFYFSMKDKKQQCKKMISCRANCSQLYLRNASPTTCPMLYEGETCLFTCLPGCKYEGGSLKRTCQSNSDWTGSPAACSSTAWKGEVDDFINKHSADSLSRDDLAEHLAEYLYSMYMDVTWVVLLYDPVGGEIHSIVSDSPDNVHAVTSSDKAYGFDFAVSRVITPVRSGFDCQDTLHSSLLSHISCAKYCHNALLSCDIRHYINCSITATKTLEVLRNYFTVNMLFAVRHNNNLVGVVARKDSASGVVSRSTSLTDTGPVIWDTRIATYDYSDCRGVHVVLVADQH